MSNCEKAEQFVCISCVDEVRYSFVSHLSEALRRKGINDVVVGIDSDDLLSKELQAKIEKARVSVMVLPGNSEPSGTCFDNFVMVLNSQRKKNQVVIPVLYGEIPLHGEWLDALDLRGSSPIHQSRKECSDSKLVEEIVRDVYEKLFVGRIGIYSKLLEIQKMVCKQPLGIRRVGIWGMPGIGKTTLAKAVFDQMSSEFDACCFVEDYNTATPENRVYRILVEQLMKEDTGNGGTFLKPSLLRDRLNSKRVLVVLDDVRNGLVADSFLEGFDWFGPESLIIITSRDKQVFCFCHINQVYEVRGLVENETLQLFLRFASIKDADKQSLHELSMEVVKYANGNPLALSIYGRELKGQSILSEMVTAFLKHRQRLPLEIFYAIKDSYDTLSHSEKNIFLDIACFFQGENIDYITQLHEGCRFFPHVGIDVLVEKSLLTISENRVRMHNLIQEFGRETINEETTEIERRSRLWEPWSIKYLLEDNGRQGNREQKTTLTHTQGTKETEGMILDTAELSFDVNPAAFENMLNLRLLKIYCSDHDIQPVINFTKDSFHYLPSELRLLHWENYPLQFLPQNFDPLHLVEINMPYSQLQKLWDGTKNLKMLRTIRLCHSQKLVEIDDILKAPNLEVIDLQDCTRLQSFPATGQLQHLRVVNLSGCTAIKCLPETSPNIETLNLQGTGIKELPHSIVKPNYTELLNLLSEIPGLSGVSNLEQSDLKPLTSLMKMSTSNHDLRKLICLELKDCSRLRSLPNMVNLDRLEVLDLSGCSELETIQGFPRNLKELYLAGTAVRQVPKLPQSLELFNSHGCVFLESIRLDFNKLPVHYTLSNCFSVSPQVVGYFLVKVLATAEHIARQRHLELNEAPAFSFCAPSHAKQISTFDLQPGASVMIQLNTSWRNTRMGFAMLVEVAFLDNYCDATGFSIRCVCRWKNKEGRSHRIERNLHCLAQGKAAPKVQKDHMFVFIDFNMNPSTYEGNDPNIWAGLVVFEFFAVNKETQPVGNNCKVTGCGVRVINATANTSLENISPAMYLDPMKISGDKVEEVSPAVYLDPMKLSGKKVEEVSPAMYLDPMKLSGKKVEEVSPAMYLDPMKITSDKVEEVSPAMYLDLMKLSGNQVEGGSPDMYLDPMEVSGNEVEKALREYECLQEIDKVLFLYIACLFNDDDLDWVRPLISSIELYVSSRLRVLATMSLIHVSSNGEVVMHCWERLMGKKIHRREAILPGSSKKVEIMVDNSQSHSEGSTITHSSNPNSTFQTSIKQKRDTSINRKHRSNASSEWDVVRHWLRNRKNSSNASSKWDVVRLWLWNRKNSPKLDLKQFRRHSIESSYRLLKKQRTSEAGTYQLLKKRDAGDSEGDGGAGGVDLCDGENYWDDFFF